MAQSYPPPQPAYGAAPPQTSTTALISLIAGVLGLTAVPLIGSIVAVITAPMAKREIIESGGTITGENLATIGQVLGWIGIGLGVLGLCLGAFFIALPFCLGLFAISTEATGSILPLLLSAFF